ncbi:MAG: lysostaphin resistance A-like protein [Candidatus Velamenicoccus archaeovorus]
MSVPVPPRPDRVRRGPEPPATARPRSTWSWWEAIAVYLVITLVTATVASPLLAIRPKGLAELVASAAIAVANVGLLVLWLSRFHEGWTAAVGLPRRWWPELRAGFGFGALLYPAITIGVGFVVTIVFSAISGQQAEPPQQVPSHLTAAGVIVSILYGVVIAPVHEELFFRGILFRSLRDRYGFAVGAGGSGVAFGLIHYLPGAWYDSVLLMTVMVFTGVALAWLYDRRGNVVANMAAHAMFNAIGLALILWLR